MIFDMLAIPANAPHPRNANLFINYLLDPHVAARNSNLVKYANGDPGIAAVPGEVGARRPRRLPAAGRHAHAGAGAGEVHAVHAPADPRVD